MGVWNKRSLGKATTMHKCRHNHSSCGLSLLFQVSSTMLFFCCCCVHTCRENGVDNRFFMSYIKTTITQRRKKNIALFTQIVSVPLWCRLFTHVNLGFSRSVSMKHSCVTIGSLPIAINAIIAIVALSYVSSLHESASGYVNAQGIFGGTIVLAVLYGLYYVCGRYRYSETCRDADLAMCGIVSALHMVGCVFNFILAAHIEQHALPTTMLALVALSCVFPLYHMLFLMLLLYLRHNKSYAEDDANAEQNVSAV